MKNFKIVHVGFGKCATTTLQKKIFPIIAKEKKINYWSNTYVLDSLSKTEMILKMNKIKNQIKNNNLNFKKNIDLRNYKNYFISCENLINTYWDPQFYKKNCNFVKKVFGKDAHIIITIRKPSDFLRSLYLELIHNSIFVKDINFFLSDKNYKKSKEKYKWNLEKFNYRNVIKYYKSNFKKVTVVKYENIKDLAFIKKLFIINKKTIIGLKKKYKDNKIHESYNRKIVRVAFLINNFFNFFGLSLYKYEKLINKFLDKSSNPNQKYLNKALKEFKLSNLLNKRVRKLFNSSEFKLNNKIYESFNIMKLDKDYEKL